MAIKSLSQAIQLNTQDLRRLSAPASSPEEVLKCGTLRNKEFPLARVAYAHQHS